jgi:uncharacterized protein
MHLDNKRIVITGAASGIGRALLLRLARYDCRIIAADRDEVRLRLVVGTLHAPAAQVAPYVVDLATHAGVDGLFAFAHKLFGGLDLFIANAGFAYYEELMSAQWERLDRILAVNTLSPLYSAVKMRELNAAAPYKMVIVASAMGQLPLPGYAVYGATKAALHSFAEAYRFELDDPRKLMLVYPIGTRTAFFETSGAPDTWPTQAPEYVADRIVRGIERDQRAVYTSLSNVLLMWLGRLLPVPRLWQQIELARFQRWRNGGGKP